MSLTSEIAVATQDMVAALRDAADDPADQVRLLAGLAGFASADFSGTDALGAVIDAAQDDAAALCRRAAAVALARASADFLPASYDAAVAIRDLVTGLLELEVIAAGDAGEDDVSQALRTLRAAVSDDLTARAASLARLRLVATAAPLPALVLAHRLYDDATRADELAGYADAPDPNFMPVSFRALAR